MHWTVQVVCISVLSHEICFKRKKCSYKSKSFHLASKASNILHRKLSDFELRMGSLEILWRTDFE